MARVLDAGKSAPEIGFMRGDGWSIGAPAYLESTCFDLWRKEWTHFIRMPSMSWHPIEFYRR